LASKSTSSKTQQNAEEELNACRKVLHQQSKQGPAFPDYPTTFRFSAFWAAFWNTPAFIALKTPVILNFSSAPPTGCSTIRTAASKPS